jgi:tetratricopeptide (TPR) repeat protein
LFQADWDHSQWAKLKQYDRALADYTSLIDFYEHRGNPNGAVNYYQGRSDIYTLQDDHKRAKAEYDKAMAILSKK